jgi:hypothetical protein
MANQVVGINVFYTVPGEEPYKKNCLVCGSLFKKLEQVNGPTSFASAMAGVSSTHDYYYCEHSDEEWHFKALKLYRAIQEMPSVSIAKIMQQDLEDILKSH